ncbi:MAG: hemin uptake protein HemP [Casimicrobiaceae bacterium]
MNDRPASYCSGDAAAPASVWGCPPEPGGGQRVVRSDALLAGASQLAILHHDTVYFLRQTRFGKLILTK